MNVEKYYKTLENIWDYHFSSLEIEPYEYDLYGKIINNIKNKQFNFTADDKNHLLNLINILIFVCDEYEIKILEIIKQHIDG